MYCTLDTLTTPTARVVSNDQAVRHLRLDSDTDELLVDSYIEVATNWVEQHLDRSLLNKTYQFTVSSGVDPYAVRFPFQTGLWYANYGPFNQPNRNVIELPRGQVQSITTVETYDQHAEVWTAHTDYSLNLFNKPAQLRLHTPVLGSNYSNIIRITYVAGYGDTDADVPAQFKLAVLMLATHLYENRGDVDADIPRVVTRLLANDRLVSYA